MVEREDRAEPPFPGGDSGLRLQYRRSCEVVRRALEARGFVGGEASSAAGDGWAEHPETLRTASRSRLGLGATHQAHSQMAADIVQHGLREELLRNGGLPESERQPAGASDGQRSDAPTEGGRPSQPRGRSAAALRQSEEAAVVRHASTRPSRHGWLLDALLQRRQAPGQQRPPR